MNPCTLAIAISFIFAFISSCHDLSPTGTLLVKAPNKGNYEIYRVASESPLQLVAEEIGYFNETMNLPIGSYLILADCSHKMINIENNNIHELTAHSVKFHPPHQAQTGDKFSVQCDRFSKTKSRQKINNRYQLHMLHGKRDLLVGMVPLRVDFNGMENPNIPKELSYSLSGIQLTRFEEMKPKTLFFISPSNNLISLTENQEFGHWLYLLPGKYTVEVNGTTKEIDLSQGESLSIDPSFVRVSTSQDLNIDLSSNILGTPLYVELNQNHWLDLNETYPVLPGSGVLKLSNSIAPLPVEFVEHLLTEKKVRSITINSDCPPWDWNCLARRKVFLYEGDKPFAFTEGITDVPVLFFEENVWVSIQGSRDIRYKLKKSIVDHEINIAMVKLKPKHSHRSGQYTDLVRIEASGLPASGHTLDLPLDREISIPLPIGKYYLGQYTSTYSQEYERKNSRKVIFAKQGSLPEISYNVFVSEKKLKALKAAAEKRKLRRSRVSAKNKKENNRAIISLDIY